MGWSRSTSNPRACPEEQAACNAWTSSVARCFFDHPAWRQSLWSRSWPDLQLTATGAQHLAWVAAAIREQAFFVLLAEMPHIQVRFGNQAPTRLEVCNRSFVPCAEDRPDHQLMRLTPRFGMGLRHLPVFGQLGKHPPRRRPCGVRQKSIFAMARAATLHGALS